MGGADGDDNDEKKPNKGSQLLRREAERERERELTSWYWLPFFMGAWWARELYAGRQQPIVRGCHKPRMNERGGGLA